nr:helix-turn-helix domain-containing protein [uncultured Alistipes sp.]
MTVEIGHIGIGRIEQTVNGDDRCFVSEDFSILLNTSRLKFLAELNRPFRIDEARIVRVLNGSATYQINLVDYAATPYSILYIPSRSIINLKAYSDDFTTQALIIKGTKDDTIFHDTWLSTLRNEDWQRISEYIDLMWRVVRKRDYSMDTIQYLQMAMLNDLWHIRKVEGNGTLADKPSRTQRTFNDFVRLINEYGATEHRIGFYADKLCLTPNRLSTLVKERSGITVVDWINHAILMEAKVLLKYSGLKNYEIADKLNIPNASFFNRFFKKHEGMTPMEYKSIK